MRLLRIDRPDGTDPIELYRPTAGQRAENVTVTVCNVTAGALTFAIYLDPYEEGFGTSNAMAYGASIGANTTITLGENAGWSVPQGAKLGCSASAADSVVFAVFGAEVSDNG